MKRPSGADFGCLRLTAGVGTSSALMMRVDMAGGLLIATGYDVTVGGQETAAIRGTGAHLRCANTGASNLCIVLAFL